MEETSGLCPKAFSVAFVNGLVVEIHFLIVMCPPTAFVIDFVVIPRSGMLGRGTLFFFFFFRLDIYNFSKNRIKINSIATDSISHTSHVKLATVFCENGHRTTNSYL